MADRGNERDDSRGGIGVGGAQDGPIGGGDAHQRQDDGTNDAGEAGGAGTQRHPSGSSRDSEKLS